MAIFTALYFFCMMVTITIAYKHLLLGYTADAYRVSSAIGRILASKVRKDHRQSPAAYIMAKLVCIGRLFLKNEINSIGLAVIASFSFS
jgi:prolipoprotein diacylglyceryltransferase